MSLGRPASNRRGRARYSLVVITLCGVSALGKSLGWSTTMTQPVMTGLLWAGPRGSRLLFLRPMRLPHATRPGRLRFREAKFAHTEYRFARPALSESRLPAQAGPV